MATEAKAANDKAVVGLVDATTIDDETVNVLATALLPTKTVDKLVLTRQMPRSRTNKLR